MTALVRYETARAALAEAKTLDEVKDIHDKAEAMRVYARLAADTSLEQDAAELRLRAKRRFGEMAAELKAAGKMHRGGRPWPDKITGATEEPVKTLAKLADLGISKKFSSQAQKSAGIAAAAFELMVEQTRARIAGGRAGAHPINAARSVAPSREEAIDSLDFFPTPPWATRALMQHVMPQIGLAGRRLGRVWEPACGEGHMSAILQEYSDDLVASDIYNYSVDGNEAPGWWCQHDFLGDKAFLSEHEWIITNPPFTGNQDRALQFALRALELAKIGVALFVRTQWLVEGGERYNKLFHARPPTLCAFFTERVPLHKGRYEPDGGTMTAYSWVVWMREAKLLAPFWIPPYCRATLTKPDDAERFTAHPVKPLIAHDPQTGEILERSSEAA